MKVYSYFASIAELDVEAEIRLSVLFRERWSAIGFEPVILNEWIAQKHPYYKEFNEAVSKLPSCNPAKYELACWHRWLALAQVGGGWMSDLDVMPTERTLEFIMRQEPTYDSGRAMWHAEEILRVYQTPCCPSFAFCLKATAERLCLEFATANIGNRPQGDRSHFSDQYAIEDLVKAGADWIQVSDVVKQYPDDGWKVAPLVHFPSAALGPRHLTPKWKHIPKLLDDATSI